MVHSLFRLPLGWLCILALAAPVLADDEGQSDLDKATQLKATAETMKDLNEVVDHLESALEKGLDEDNTEFAEQLLVASLVQRGSLFAAELTKLSADDPQANLRAIQLRAFALSDLQRAVELEKDIWEAQLLIGKLQMQSLPVADLGAARRALSRVVEAEAAGPDVKAEAYALRSALQKDPKKQLEDLSKAVELQPDKPEFLRLRGQHYFSREKLDEALADFDQAIKLEPDHAMSHELRGVILLGLNKADEALASFNRATELVPDAALPYQHRGELYLQKGDLEKGLEQLTKAVDLAAEKNQDKYPPLLVRARIYFQLKQPDKALADVEEAIKIHPERLQPHLMQVEIYASTGRMDDAVSQLEKLVKLAPDNVDLLNRLGSFYLMANKPRKAIETLDRVIELDPSDFAALRFRADAYLGIGEHAEAVADFAKAYAINPDDESLLNNYAWVLATSPDDDVRDGDKALKLATKAADLSKHETAHILSTLGAAHAEKGDFENAKKASQEAIAIAEKAVSSATDDTDRAQRQTELDQLKKELVNYEEGKPVRERQNTGEAADAPAKEAPATDDTDAKPADKAAEDDTAKEDEAESKTEADESEAKDDSAEDSSTSEESEDASDDESKADESEKSEDDAPSDDEESDTSA